MSSILLKKAIEVLNKGGIIVFPTETAFGVGCRVDDKEAVRRLIEIRQREKGKPFLVLAADLRMAQKYWRKLPLAAKKLAQKFWPGPLTIIYSCQKDLVSTEVRADGQTLGIRVSPHKVTLQLIKGVGVPILAPSANFAGEQTPFKFSDLDQKFLELVDFVIKAPCGKYKKPSTVIDCTKKPWQILREGAITREEIFEKIKPSS